MEGGEEALTNCHDDFFFFSECSIRMCIAALCAWVEIHADPKLSYRREAYRRSRRQSLSKIFSFAFPKGKANAEDSRKGERPTLPAPGLQYSHNTADRAL